MAACGPSGAIHSVVFGGFAPPELATRIDDAKPHLVISASCGLEPGRVVGYKALLDEAIRLAKNPPRHCLILQRPMHEAALVPRRDLDCHAPMDAAQPAGWRAVAAAYARDT